MSITPRGERSDALAAFGIVVGPHAGDEVPVRSPVATVGRGGQNEIVLDDDSVSTTHARLEYESGVWRVTDLNSTNGTIVEGVRLAPEVTTPLPYGSTVQFGGVRLHFRAVEEADPDTARAEYTPPPEPGRKRPSGLRLPLWVLVLVLLAIALAVYYFTLGPAESPVALSAALLDELPTSWTARAPG